MKLRIKGNTIRLRLLKSEVERFALDGRISEETNFGSGTLRYSIAAAADVASIVSTFENNEILVKIPEATALEWSTGDGVSLENQQGDTLTILIEKDFACLDRPDDPDRDDAFPNPNAACAPAE